MNCPVCLSAATAPAFSGNDLLFETTSKTFNLNSCSACRCLFMNPMPSSDEISSFYPARYWWSSRRAGLLKTLETVYRRIVLRDHIRFITDAAASRAGLEILDVGCGSGTLLALLEKRGFRPLGVDVSHEASRIAEEENGIRVVEGSLWEARFADRSFDIVTLFHVMEHVSNPREVLAEVSRILKPDGVMMLQVPNIDSWQFKVFGSKWYGLDIPRHLIDYSKRSILRLLAGSGFEATRMKHFNLRDNAPALAASLFPSLDPVSREAPSWMRHAAFFSLVMCAYPFAMLEAAFGHGATLMIEARKR